MLPPRAHAARFLTDLTGVHTLTFQRSAAIVLLDCLNSAMRSRGRVIESTRFHKVMNQYAELFARMTACWQRVLCLSSPDAKFWEIVDSDRFDLARNQLEDLARTCGIVVVRSSPLLELVGPYRRPGDPWHFAGSRQEDYGRHGVCAFQTTCAWGLPRFPRFQFRARAPVW